ncbi:TetR family transcriptional regulator [Mycobacterium crocinum]|uniref:TetR family transcriptional regulator n=1 Tax=Mycolicibacterium crocinum TaxID=388459 RepID=A0ABY3TGH9_9MYCO|nr:TetR family transcriptional regulator [Mycolicibacterium crocinum]MCV7214331.1 TetR family transcriptional regulator [Mycolicibacterium crocinum]ULN39834.1 TetR family transcriptional regulator [Mycolicibacterium crocinum]
MSPPAPQDDRRLTLRGRATRDRIVAAAADVILDEGLSGLNNETLRRVASVSGSQLAHYFADKRALIAAVLAKQIEVVLDFHRQPKLRGLESLDDYETWIALNLRYLRRIGYAGTPTYHALAAQLAKSDADTRAALADGYWAWISFFEKAIQQMKDRRILTSKADPHQLAVVLVATHQGSGAMTFTYHQEWPLADGLRFAVNRIRAYATDPAMRTPRPPRRVRRPAHTDGGLVANQRFTRKGLETRARIIDTTAALMFQRGATGTSIEDVRVSAGVSGSQMSHYFGDKRDLTREVVASRRQQVRGYHTDPKFGSFDRIRDLQAWADACVEDIDTVYRLGGCVYGSLAGELIDSDDRIRADLAAGYDEWIGLFVAGLTAMRDRGELAAEASPRHLAASLVIAHQGGAMLTHVTDSPEPLRVNVNAAVDYVRTFAVRPAKRKR